MYLANLPNWHNMLKKGFIGRPQYVVKYNNLQNKFNSFASKSKTSKQICRNRSLDSAFFVDCSRKYLSVNTKSFRRRSSLFIKNLKYELCANALNKGFVFPQSESYAEQEKIVKPNSLRKVFFSSSIYLPETFQR